MLDFGEKIKKLIEVSGLNIYQLSKSAGLDRTTIQRTITGQRLPSLKFVAKLCDYLKVSPSEEKEVYELYNISKIGNKVYLGRKYIKQIIERMAAINNHGNSALDIQKSVSIAGQIDEDATVFTGQYTINNMIRVVLEDEVLNNQSPQIDISVPFSFNFLYDLLYQLYLWKNGQFDIRSLVRLSKNPHSLQNSNYNLEILSHTMTFAFSAGNRYQSYYYYDNFDSSNDIALLMPFYIITGKRLITISSDFKTAILYNNKEIVDTYKDNFGKALLLAKPFIVQHISCDDVLSLYSELDVKYGRITHLIEPQPCLAWYFTQEIINKKLRKDIENRELLLSLLNQFYSGFKEYTNRPIAIFSIEGMEYFVDTGVIADIPPQFAVPFTLEERAFLLKQLRNEIASGVYPVYAANPSRFQIPYSTIQLHGMNALFFFTADNNCSILSTRIEEKSITEAFGDFFDSLSNSDLIFGKDETLKIIDDFISKIEN